MLESNEFDAMDISQVNETVLNNHDVVIVGDMPLSAGNVTMLTNWVNAGGTLIALKPDAQLASLMGITKVSGSLTDKYLSVNASGPGAGIVNQTIQFHGTADLYNLNGATGIAMLYSAAGTATSNPAVTMNNVGSNGGVAIAFTYDLARSVVYTRQGNPAWAGQKRDNQIDPIRSDDMFYPDWVDFDKIAIPQADEQQHLLSNLILAANQHRKPLPRFWFLPKGLKAAVVMTGDDHGNGGTIGRFNQYISLSTSNTAQAVADWTAIRGTSYIYTNTPISDAQVAAFQSQGFEIALHLTTNCQVWTPASLENDLNTQLSQLTAAYPGVNAPVTNRTHCISWSDWASQPKIEALKGIRLDANYYYWPAAWVQNRPGMFTGSGMPMRFADLDGTLIDCYQLTTQMPDESGEVFPGFIDALLNKAIGPEGYYGVFCANMHTDNASSSGSDAIIASAQSKQIPVVSAKQMLEWLDGRNGSSFGSLVWNNNQLSFMIAVGAGANNLKAMLPVTSSVGQLTGITFNSSPVAYETQTIKGVQYAFFNAAAGNYVASYAVDNVAPVISDVNATPHSDGTATITWTTDEPSSSKVDYGTEQNDLSQNSDDAALVTAHSITLTGLSAGVTYYFEVTSVDAANNSASAAGSPVAYSFSVPTAPCVQSATAADFDLGTTDANTLVILANDGEVILKPALNQEFSGTTIPSEWTSGNFNPGATTVMNGSVTVNGTHLYTNNSFGPGASLEFAATYNLGAFQNVGFSNDQAFDSNPWITIGQGQSPDGNLYARFSDGTAISLGSNLLGSLHQYRIQWNANNFTFYVDGSSTPAATINATLASAMYVQISDVLSNDGSLSVDWLRVSPYAPSGVYGSKVFDQGSPANWGVVSWNASTPAGTSLTVQVRKGNTPTPDASWTNFTDVVNGGNIGGNSQYLQYRVNLSTSNNTVTPVFSNINVECNAGEDNTPPIITNVNAQPSADGTSVTITWQTNEPANSSVNYGTNAGTLNNQHADANAVTSHSITLTGLTPGTVYYYRVSSSDGSINTATEPALPAAPLSFTTLIPACFTDVVAADFDNGIFTNTYLTIKTDGEVTLKPSAGTEFTNLPSATEWANFAWTGGGSSTVSDGVLSVDGQRFNNEPEGATFSPGAVLEFVATFGAASYQHIGFAGGTDVIGSGGIYNGESPWAMFSTGSGTSTLKTRTFSGSSSNDVDLGAFLGTPHLYRIEWLANGTFNYYIDGSLVRNETNIAVNTPMRVAVSDYNADGTDIKVDWIHVTPYIASGSFESRVYNAGSKRKWGNISWTAQTPSSESSGTTTLSVSVRTGNTPVPDETWSAYNIVSNNGAVNSSSQYIQYKADLSTTSAAITPVLENVSVTCSEITGEIPQVTINPSNASMCAGTAASFSSAATGTPTPTVQWQVSADNGDSWNNIPGATSNTLSFNTITQDNGKKYRTVWTNDAGTAVSTAATLTVNKPPAITQNPVSQDVCAKTTVSFSVVAEGTGLTYQWRKNGKAISNATGSTLTLTNVTTTASGNYDVIVNGACSPSATSTVAVLVIHPLPAVFNVTGGGTTNDCGNTGLPVGLSGSEISATYQLLRSGVNQGAPVNGTGSPISFGNQIKGTYTVVATRTATGCTSKMSGSAIVKQTGLVPPQPGLISLDTIDNVTNLCGGGNFTYRISAVPGALSYVWTPVTGGSVVANNGTSALLSFPATFSTGSVKVRAQNNCGLSTIRSLAVRSVVKPIGISGPTSVTKQQSVIYTVIKPDLTVTYQWTVPTGVVINGGQGTPTLNVKWRSTAGVIKVATRNDCGTSAAASLSVAVVSTLATDAKFATATTIETDLSVSPNPTNGRARLYFTAHTKDKYTVEVIDMYGKVIMLREGVSIQGTNQVELDLSNKPQAMYFISLISKETGRKTVRLIKTR